MLHVTTTFIQTALGAGLTLGIALLLRSSPRGIATGVSSNSYNLVSDGNMLEGDHGIVDTMPGLGLQFKSLRRPANDWQRNDRLHSPA